MRLVQLIAIATAFMAAAWIIYAVVPTYTMKLWQLARSFCHRSDGRTLYLTFDDGPSPAYTSELLDLLKELNIAATFFVVGAFAADNPALIKRMRDEGHAIGLHSYAHQNGLFLGPRATCADLAKSQKVLAAQGVSARWCRPPWGHFNVAMIMCIARRGFKPFLWDVMAQDWSASSSVSAIEEKLKRRVRDGAIICLHDGRGSNHAPARTIAALRSTLPYLQSEGYRFETAERYNNHGH